MYTLDDIRQLLAQCQSMISLDEDDFNLIATKSGLRCDIQPFSEGTFGASLTDTFAKAAAQGPVKHLLLAIVIPEESGMAMEEMAALNQLADSLDDDAEIRWAIYTWQKPDYTLALAASGE